VRDAVLKNHEDIPDSPAVYKWFMDPRQRDLREPLEKRTPAATTKVPVVRRIAHYVDKVEQCDVKTVHGSSKASSIVPYNLGRRVLFQRLACTCAACNTTEPDTNGCAYAYLTQNVTHGIHL